MSTRKGGAPKRPAHQNKFAFKHNPKSKKTAKILAIPISGICGHCTEVLEWRKKYRKFKPLTQPRRCQDCDEKTVSRAYHIICDKCARSKRICAKCRTPFDLGEAKPEDQKQVTEVELRLMSERERRTYLRRQQKRPKRTAGDSDGEESECQSEGDSDAEGACEKLGEGLNDAYNELRAGSSSGKVQEGEGTLVLKGENDEKGGDMEDGDLKAGNMEDGEKKTGDLMEDGERDMEI